MELFVDAWPVIEAAAPFSVPVEVIDKRYPFGTYHMTVDWIRLLERQDVEVIDTRVEEGGVVRLGLSIGRNRSFPISAQQY